MAQQQGYIHGLGHVVVQDPIDKSFTPEETVTLSVKAGGNDGDGQQTISNVTQRLKSQTELATVITEVNKAVQEHLEQKHELTLGAEHTHKKLVQSDAKYRDEFDENGNPVVETKKNKKLAVGDVEYREELDPQTGTEDMEKLTEPKTTKSLSRDDRVLVVEARREAIVKSYVDDEVIVQYKDGALEAVHISDVMPSEG